MNRIERTFQRLKQEGRKALVGYLTAGDPDLATSEGHVRAALENGLDVLELGVPFSDPTADGPTIQAAGQRALASGTTVEGILAMARRLRRDYETPIILFGYVNPFFVHGYEKTCEQAKAAGVDGFLVVDLPFEESDELRKPLTRNGLAFIPLIAPTTSSERAARILKEAQGFVYYIMVKGVTGVRDAVAADASVQLAALRRCTALPIVAGFGVADGRQAKAVASLADGVVVGSAMVRAAHENRLPALVRELRSALG